MLNLTRAAYKITNSYPSLSVLFTIACISYLALEEGSPLFKQVKLFYFLGNIFSLFFSLNNYLFSFTLLIESLLISFPEATKIFQFASFKYRIFSRVHVPGNIYVILHPFGTFGTTILFNIQLDILNNLFIYLP